ncbi:hypothetical protein E1287_09675 [Actinomadura sp. KC06]|nr:hypothetical protein E1287_09675 [Actinomadura sp. KC06]
MLLLHITDAEGAFNIGGTATLVGDPPDIIIASRGNLSFNDFLVHLAPLVVLLIVVFCLIRRWLFRSAFHYDPELAAEDMELEEREAIIDRRLLAQGLTVLAIVVATFVLHPVLHYEPSVVALLGAGLLVAATKVTTEDAPIVSDLVQDYPGDEGQVLWWALALGADLGGSATAIGASANVVLGIAARNGTPISFWQFTRYGLVVTFVTVTLATPYLWLRYL